MYQVEVKKALVKYLFPTTGGWQVTMDLDAMEMGKGPQNPERKRAVAEKARTWLLKNGVTLEPHKVLGRADLVACHARRGTVVLEVEGDSSRQQEQSLYSALGQLVLSMKGSERRTRYGLAVPDTLSWRRQLAKIPRGVRQRLRLELLLVSRTSVKAVKPGDSLPT